MSVESLRCRNCGAALEAGRVDRTLGIVTCAHCGGLHELAGATADGGAARREATPGGRGGRGASGGAVERGTVPLPSRFEVYRGDGALQVRWSKGNRSGAVILGAFALIWAFAAVSTGLLFLAPVSLLLLYYAAVRAFNRTTLRVDGAGVGVRRGPLPWGGARRSMARADIAQLFASEQVRRTRSGSDGNPDWREHRSYRLEAIDREGRRRPLVGGLAAPDQALWLEREAETLLGIDDAAVAVEYR